MSRARVRTCASSSTTRMVSISGPILPPSPAFLSSPLHMALVQQRTRVPAGSRGPLVLTLALALTVTRSGPRVGPYEKVDRRPESGLAPLVRLVRDRQGQPPRHHRPALASARSAIADRPDHRRT